MEHIKLFEQFINEKNRKGLFVIKTGEAYQSLWNNSSPSITYKDTSEIFTNLNDAVKFAKNALKAQKTKTSMGQGGIPGGYSYTIVHLYEITNDMNPETWKIPVDAKKDNAILIPLSSSGQLEEDVIKKTAEIKALSSPEAIKKITPDKKDIMRAEKMFQDGWVAGDKAIKQLISISNPVKLVRRMKAMLYAQIKKALTDKIYYKGYELEKGIDKWLQGFPWLLNSSYYFSFYKPYNKKWDTDLTFEDTEKLFKAVTTEVFNQIKEEY